MNEGENRLLACTEITAETKVNTGKHAVPYVAAKILTSCENYTIIGSEQTTGSAINWMIIATIRPNPAVIKIA